MKPGTLLDMLAALAIAVGVAGGLYGLLGWWAVAAGGIVLFLLWSARETWGGDDQ